MTVRTKKNASPATKVRDLDDEPRAQLRANRDQHISSGFDVWLHDSAVGEEWRGWEGGNTTRCFSCVYLFFHSISQSLEFLQSLKSCNCGRYFQIFNVETRRRPCIMGPSTPLVYRQHAHTFSAVESAKVSNCAAC